MMAAKRSPGGRSGRFGKTMKSSRAKARRGSARRSAALMTRETAAKRKPARAARKKGGVEAKKAGGKVEHVQLRTIAQARSGDKGDIANIALFAPTEEMYEVFCREVTAERVKAHFGDFVKGPVERYEVPNVRGLNFVAHASLGGGGAASLRSDPLGKSYGSNLLRMKIPVPSGILKRTPKWRPPKELPEV